MSSLLCCEGIAYYFWFEDLQVYSALMKGIFNFERRAVLNLFKKTKNKTHLQSAVFVASTSITIIMTSIPTINFGKLVNALNISQMWWRSQWLSLQFNQYLRQSTRNEIFPTFTSPIRVDFKFPTFTSPMQAFVVCTYYVLYRLFFLKSWSCFIYLLQG